MSLTIGVDIGGTKVGGGVVDESGNVLATTRRPTPADNTPGVIQAVKEVVEELRAGREIEAVGIGAAGWISSDRSTVMLAPNLSWKDEPLRDKVAAAIDLPVVVENDANVAIWGEHRFGAAKTTAPPCSTRSAPASAAASSSRTTSCAAPTASPPRSATPAR